MGEIQFNFNPLTETTYHDRGNQVNHFIVRYFAFETHIPVNHFRFIFIKYDIILHA